MHSTLTVKALSGGRDFQDTSGEVGPMAPLRARETTSWSFDVYDLLCLTSMLP